jgi:hypothetical protein
MSALISAATAAGVSTKATVELRLRQQGLLVT